LTERLEAKGLEFQRFDTSFLVEGSHPANLIWLSGILNF